MAKQIAQWQPMSGSRENQNLLGYVDSTAVVPEVTVFTFRICIMFVVVSVRNNMSVDGRRRKAINSCF